MTESETQPINQSVNSCVLRRRRQNGKIGLFNAVEERRRREEKKSWESARVISFLSFLCRPAAVLSGRRQPLHCPSSKTLCVPYARLSVCMRTPSLLRVVCFLFLGVYEERSATLMPDWLGEIQLVQRSWFKKHFSAMVGSQGIRCHWSLLVAHLRAEQWLRGTTRVFLTMHTTEHCDLVLQIMLGATQQRKVRVLYSAFRWYLTRK